MIFNLGMVEMISYWKSVCSPKVRIRAGALDEGQITFWKKLFHHGLGEFFYLNEIQPGKDLVEFISEGDIFPDDHEEERIYGSKILVPVGGGKDSTVTLEALKREYDCIPFIMNPRKASLATTDHAGFTRDEIICSSRSIDSNLLELNKKGFLNGHTPFSAVLAFTGLIVACLHGYSKIVLSNESSANEPTIPGTMINHQYSKSLEFENDFRSYIAKYMGNAVNYYSFLRPLNELQIAGLFSKLSHHHRSFRSCNVGSKTDTWCGRCPKCLFTFIILSPFIAYEKLVLIFGKDLLDDGALIPILDQLTGVDSEKPFECVGTISEVNIAMLQLLHTYKDTDKPQLLQHYASQNNTGGITLREDFKGMMMQFDVHNISAEKDVSLLKNLLDDIRY